MKSNKKNNLIIGFSNNPRTSSLHGNKERARKAIGGKEEGEEEIKEKISE